MDDRRYRELYQLEDRHWWFRDRRAVTWARLAREGIDRAGEAKLIERGVRLPAGVSAGVVCVAR